MSALINSKNVLTFFLLIASICQFFDGVFGSNGTLTIVEGNLNNFVATRQIQQLEMAKKELANVSPRSERVLNLATMLGEVDPKAHKGDPKNERILHEAKMMFIPLIDSRNILYSIKYKMGVVGYQEFSQEWNEHLIESTFKVFAANQQKMMREASQMNYKFLEAALNQLGKAIAEFKAKHVPYSVPYGPLKKCVECKQIEKMASTAIEVALCQVFDLYAAKK